MTTYTASQAEFTLVRAEMLDQQAIAIMFDQVVYERKTFVIMRHEQPFAALLREKGHGLLVSYKNFERIRLWQLGEESPKRGF